MPRSIVYGLAGCVVLWVGCAKDSAANAPEPAASQGSEATPEPRPQPAALDPAAAPAEEPAAALTPAPPIPAPDTALSDAQVVGIVGEINAGEIAQAQLAKSRAKDARVKKFAQHMITQHTDAQQRMAALGKHENMAAAESSVQSDLTVASAADVDTLKGASAADFDAIYMTNQVKQHQAALDMLTNRLIPAATDPKLKALLESTRTTVDEHLKSANDIQRALLSSTKAQ